MFRRTAEVKRSIW